MTELIKLPEFLERQSKSSSGIMLIIVCIGLVFGSLMIYVGIQTEDTRSVLGVIMVALSFVLLVLLYYQLYINEKKLRFQILGSSSVQMKVDQLNLQIKLIEYNEKAIAYNEKNESPEMKILNLNDLTGMMIDTFPE